MKKDRRLGHGRLAAAVRNVVSTLPLSAPRGRKYIDTFSTYWRSKLGSVLAILHSGSIPLPFFFLFPTFEKNSYLGSAHVRVFGVCHGHGNIALLYWLGRVPTAPSPGIESFLLELAAVWFFLARGRGNCASCTSCVLSLFFLDLHFPIWHLW
jgi:hypothetical protein